jgi:PAS domain S-box-containing protein
MHEKTHPLQTRLRQLIVVTSGIALLLTSVVYFIFEYNTFRQTEKQHLVTLAKIIASNASAPLAFDDHNNATEILNALTVEEHIRKACIYDAGSRIFAKFPSGISDSLFPRMMRGEHVFYSGASLQCFEPVNQPDGIPGVLYLQSDLSIIYSRFMYFTFIAFLVVGISMAISIIFSRRLQHSITRPILQLSESARTVSSRGDYSVRAQPSKIREANVLTKTFNQMLDRIDSQNQDIIRFNRELEQKINERTKELAGSNLKLQQQNELVGTILDSSVDLIAVVDRDLRYLIINKAALKAYGKSSEELIGHSMTEVFPDLRSSEMPGNLQTVLQGTMVHIEKYYSSILNGYLDSFYIPLFDKAGEVGRILIIAHDITEIISSHEHLVELNAELKKSNEHLEQFAYIASHDLQEPLRKIQTFSEIVETEIDNREYVQKYMGKIRVAASRMSDLVQSILHYSRISYNQEDFVPIDLNKLVEATKTDLEMLIESKGAIIETGPLPHIRGLAPQMMQLFLNLISNSLKFCDVRPVISIQAATLKPDDPASKKFSFMEGCIKLCFQDNGIGFEQKYADKIFSIFQRLHDPKKYPGTGIGLALCKKIVEMHKGYIEVSSNPGQGTTVVIYLPESLLIS